MKAEGTRRKKGSEGRWRVKENAIDAHVFIGLRRKTATILTLRLWQTMQRVLVKS